jgi:hypothetical protein
LGNFIAALALVAHGRAVAGAPSSPLGEFNFQQGQLYSVVKAVLLKRGWTPDTQYGNGTAPFGLNEVVCGNGWDAVCSARFFLGSRKIVVTLKPRRALQVDDILDEE